MRFRRMATGAWLSASVLVVAGFGVCVRGADAPAKPESLEAALAKIETQQAKVPRDRIDPAVIANEAGGDPAKLLAWVRDNTSLVAYDASLRGSLGVLMDRAGNSLDRSLLLARLLELGGFEARIVSAKLPAADYAKIFAENGKPSAVPATEAEANAKDRQAFVAQASSISSTILAKTGPLSLADAGADPTHYWVQFNDGKSWVDLDPTLPGAPGQARAKAEGSPITLDPTTHSLPQDSKLSQAVKLWLIVERWENGKLISSPLVTYTFDARRTPIETATLIFLPVDQKQSKTVQRTFTSGAQLREKVLAETAWSPIVTDGKSGGRMSRMFNDAGVVGDLPKSFDGAAQIGNINRNAFGGMMGGLSGGGQAAEASSVLTALVADYQITVPGKPVRHVKRFIFDSIGPDARRSTQPLPRPKWTEQQLVDRGADLASLNDMLVAFASMPPEAYIYRYAQRAIDSKDAAIKVSKGSVDGATMERFINGCTLHTLELFAASRDSDLSPDLAVAEPQVYRRIVRYEPDAKARDLQAEIYSDLAWNRLAPFRFGSGSAATIVNQGVLDTLKESVVVLRDKPAGASDDTAAILAEAEKQGIEIVAIRDARDSHLDAFAGATRARMLQDLDAGQILVGPAKPVAVDGKPRTGWWRVDPTSAQVVGEMDTGLLQEFVEYSETEDVNGITVTRFYRVRVDPAAREWAENMIRQRTETSWQQWTDLLTYAQRAIINGRFPMI